MRNNYKKVSSHGSINIPVAMRREMGLQGGDPMEVSKEEDKIVIRPYTPRCLACEGTEEVVQYLGINICNKCVAKVLEKMKGEA